MIIGLTGGIGSGKSTAAKMFRSLGVTVISSDEISHQLLAPNQPAFNSVLEHFGNSILNTDRTLDRNAIRNIIFKTEKERHWLENLLHPLIKAEILKQSSLLSREPYLILEIPLLIEAGFEDIVDRVLVVDCPEALQLERVMKRDRSSFQVVKAMLNTQVSRDLRLAKAHDVIENTSDLNALRQQILDLHPLYIKLSK